MVTTPTVRLRAETTSCPPRPLGAGRRLGPRSAPSARSRLCADLRPGRGRPPRSPRNDGEQRLASGEEGSCPDGPCPPTCSPHPCSLCGWVSPWPWSWLLSRDIGTVLAHRDCGLSEVHLPTQSPMEPRDGKSVDRPRARRSQKQASHENLPAP